ncbi:MAG TPA: DUF4388 domain-containing protein [Ktedonobacteraceae bacterium]|nr:DUF4388 domain-containing protein [Ktedonobacteraceae bacterium]
MSQALVFGGSWQGSFADLANIVQYIRGIRAFGRLSLRNLEHISVVHFYFRAGKLVHIAGYRGDARAMLADIRGWRRGTLRFDPGTTVAEVTLGDEYEQILSEVLVYLHYRGTVSMPQTPSTPRVVESKIMGSSETEQQIAPDEWQLLMEGIRRVSQVVAHLVGPKEALQVLQDILDDCASSFPAFASLKIAPSGYLQVTDRSGLDRMSRNSILEGFAALIAICQHFCAPVIGERDAHQLMLRTLRELGPPLANLGVFRVDNLLLARSD